MIYLYSKIIQNVQTQIIHSHIKGSIKAIQMGKYLHNLAQFYSQIKKMKVRIVVCLSMCQSWNKCFVRMLDWKVCNG